eukprot:scaffold10025_cov119-Isochrysis_galbana.AAC.5
MRLRVSNSRRHTARASLRRHTTCTRTRIIPAAAWRLRLVALHQPAAASGAGAGACESRVAHEWCSGAADQANAVEAEAANVPPFPNESF